MKTKKKSAKRRSKIKKAVKKYNKKTANKPIKKIAKTKPTIVEKNGTAKSIVTARSIQQVKLEPLGIGIHDNVPADFYKADPCKLPSLSSSIAHIMIAESPYHAWFNHPRLNKNFKPHSNGHFDLGTAAHEFILEGSEKSIVVINADDYRTNAAKEARENAHEIGKIPILKHQYDKVQRMAEVFFREIEKCDDLRGVFARSKFEQTGIWREGDMWSRVRFDILPNDHDLIIDYKTSESANPDYFIRSPLVNFGYDLRASFYMRGLKTLSDRSHDAKYIWIVQEVHEPYDLSIVGYSDQMADTADRKVEHAITLWNDCMKSNVWPGYSKRVAWAYLPDYAVRRYEEYEASQGLITSSEQLS